MNNNKLEVILLLDHRSYLDVLKADGWIGQIDKADIIDHTSRALGELYGFNVYYNRSIRYNINILDSIKSILWSCLKFNNDPLVIDHLVEMSQETKWLSIKIIPVFKDKR